MYKTIQIIAVLQGLFVLFILFVNRKDYKKIPFWLLFGSLVSMSLYLIGDDENNLFIENTDWFLFDNTLFVTFLFLFFRYYKNGKEKFSQMDYLFFVPNLLYFILEIIELQLTQENTIVEILELFTELTFIIYLSIALYSIFSDKMKHWIIYFAIPIVLLFALSLVNNILKILQWSQLSFFDNKQSNTYLLLIVAFLFYFIAFKLLSKGKEILPKNEISKYNNSNLNRALIPKYKSDLIYAMETKKLFLNEKLSIQDVAEHLNIPRQHISEVLNQHMNVSFQDFINQYRVEEFIIRLKNDQNNNFTLLAIATEVGFNSKSSFNATFKKFKGLTPTEFKKTNS